MNLNDERIAEIFSDRYFNLILFPTEKCNFRCNYCYEDFLIGKMKKNTVEGIKQLILSRVGDLDVFEISWFGGEPLLASDIVLDINKTVCDLKKHYKFKYISNITTNGFLLDENMFNELITSGTSFFQVTLDGDETLHNSIAGRECFSQVFENLLSARSSTQNFIIEIRVHYSPDTWCKLSSLIALLNENFASDDRFRVYFKSLEKYGGVKDDNITLFDYQTNKRIKSFLDSQLAHEEMIYSVPYNEEFICYASKPTSLAIRADGSVAKCTAALQQDYNNVGILTDKGELELDQGKIRVWLKGLSTGDNDYLQCPNSQLKKKEQVNFFTLSQHQITSTWKNLNRAIPITFVKSK